MSGPTGPRGATGPAGPRSNTLRTWSRAFERRVDAGIAWLKRHWWTWPASLVLFALATVVTSLLFAPGPEERVLFQGHTFGEPCGFYMTTGMPCPQCGMTRSWVWAARGHVVTSFLYNPAGATLFWWIVIAGVVGAARLATGRPSWLAIPPRALLAWTLFWTVGLYLIPWVLRIGWGLNPLPTPFFLLGHPVGGS